MSARRVGILSSRPEIYGHVRRWPFGRVLWYITAGPDGLILDWGRTWTRGGAWMKAISATTDPDVTARISVLFGRL